MDSRQVDDDGDATMFGQGVPNPKFAVRANVDRVEAFEWPLGATLTLQVNGVTVATQEVGPAPWDPNITYAWFDLAGTTDLQPENEVSLSDGVTTKDTTVTELEITEIDIVTDIVTGKAARESTVDLWASDGVTNVNRHVVADEDGVWSADFSIVGSGQDEQNTFDIVPGTWVDSQQVDDDGDATMFGQAAPVPD